MTDDAERAAPRQISKERLDWLARDLNDFLVATHPRCLPGFATASHDDLAALYHQGTVVRTALALALNLHRQPIEVESLQGLPLALLDAAMLLVATFSPILERWRLAPVDGLEFEWGDPGLEIKIVHWLDEDPDFRLPERVRLDFPLTVSDVEHGRLGRVYSVIVQVIALMAPTASPAIPILESSPPVGDLAMPAEMSEDDIVAALHKGGRKSRPYAARFVEYMITHPEADAEALAAHVYGHGDCDGKEKALKGLQSRVNKYIKLYKSQLRYSTRGLRVYKEPE